LFFYVVVLFYFALEFEPLKQLC